MHSPQKAFLVNLNLKSQINVNNITVLFIPFYLDNYIIKLILDNMLLYAYNNNIQVNAYKGEINMRTTLNIPDDLINEVQKISGEKSKTKAIVKTMQEYIKQKQKLELLSLKGKINIDYDWEKEEELELNSQFNR